MASSVELIALGALAAGRARRSAASADMIAGHAFVQNLRRGHYDIATDTPDRHKLRIAFDDLALTI